MVNKQTDRWRQRAKEDYLKALYQLNDGAPVKAADLARHLRVSRVAVSKFRRVLEDDGLIRTSRARVDPLALTRQGQTAAARMVRRHRLVETFLHRSLGMPLDRVHGDAEKMEHSISDDIARRLSLFLGHPLTDPHGHPIPGSAGKRPRGTDIPLSSVLAGQTVEIASVDDKDDKTVRRLIALGVLPGMRAVVVGSDGDGLHIKTGPSMIHMSLAAAGRVRCRTSRG